MCLTETCNSINRLAAVNGFGENFWNFFRKVVAASRSRSGCRVQLRLPLAANNAASARSY